VKNSGFDKCMLVLDNLPGDTPGEEDGYTVGIEIIKTITRSSPTLSSIAFESIQEANIKDFTVTYSLVDWLAQSCHAAINADFFRKNMKSGKKEAMRKDVAGLIFTLLKSLFMGFFGKWYQRGDLNP